MSMSQCLKGMHKVGGDCLVQLKGERAIKGNHGQNENFCVSQVMDSSSRQNRKKFIMYL